MHTMHNYNRRLWCTTCTRLYYSNITSWYHLRWRVWSFWFWLGRWNSCMLSLHVGMLDSCSDKDWDSQHCCAFDAKDQNWWMVCIKYVSVFYSSYFISINKNNTHSLCSLWIAISAIKPHKYGLQHAACQVYNSIKLIYFSSGKV